MKTLFFVIQVANLQTRVTWYGPTELASFLTDFGVSSDLLCTVVS